MIPAIVSKEEKRGLALEMNNIRRQKLQETTEEDRILADVMRLRFQIVNYIRKEGFSFDKSFGKYLEEYVRILNKSRKELCVDLNLHYTKLSRIVND